jgi:uroporphyrin-III C-methyltransferase/precorrin-2 dehydrogenase/sirohydrochlorin ferrochelatase
MPELFPLFLRLAGRAVVLVGGGRVATSKLRALLGAGARVKVVAPSIADEIAVAGVELCRREFVPADLEGAWFVVAAATAEVNRQVAAAADTRRIFVNAVDDPVNASAYLSGTVRRDGVTVALSTSGDAPALTALLREALDRSLPRDLDRWMAEARRQRIVWRRDGVPIAERKPRLLVALNQLYEAAEERREEKGGAGSPGGAEQPRSGDDRALRDPPVDKKKPPAATSRPPAAEGHVSLVGAGPGDPGLLTRTAIARLRAADLVLYDALIDDRVLRYARKAQRFFAGKRAARSGGGGRGFQAMTQETIHAVMIRAAHRGRRVVRLKGGDPFVFGRGGEEALALRRAGVAYDVVPGVTSAVAAPALAGIPVTHRGVASAFLVVAGHDLAAFTSAIEPLRPGRVTLVVLMAVGHAEAIADVLIAHGWPEETPVALVVNASRPDQQTWRRTLKDLGSLFAHGAESVQTTFNGPGTIVVGDVVRFSEAVAEIEGIYASSR